MAFIHKCACCQKMDQRKPQNRSHPFVLGSYVPMQKVSVDTIGPLEKDHLGNQYILVIIDCFTRWTELYSVPDTSAEKAAIVLIQHVGRFGVPERFRTDQGTQFANKLISELAVLLGCHHDLTLAYSKQENAIVERENKEVMRHLNAILFDKRVRDKWGEYDLPMVQRIINAATHSSIGVSPAQLLFGGALNLDRGILLPFPPREEHPNQEIPLSTRADQMLSRQQELLRVAYEHQRQKDERHLESSDPANVTEFPINSYVLMSHINRPPDKFTTPHAGPLQVVARSGSKYTVRNLITDARTDVHISRLKPFLFDPTKTDPRDVALLDAGEFEIDKILDHDGDPSRKLEMQFLVKWKGFDESHNSWEPWKHLYNTSQLHLYLRQKKMARLIPQHLK